MLNKGRFEQKWVFFFKIKVIYMIMYEFLFSLKAFVHCKTISFFDFDGCFFHNFCGMLSPTTIYRNVLLSHSHIKYDLLIQTLQTNANYKCSRYGIKMTCISKLCTLKQSQLIYMVRGLISQQCHIGPQIALFSIIYAILFI